MMANDLFDYAAKAVRRTDPATSKQAARRNPDQRSVDRLRVLKLHAEHPEGLTDFQLAAILRGQQTSLGKRRGELRDEGLIAETTERRPSPSGSPSIVWKITEAGKAEAKP